MIICQNRLISPVVVMFKIVTDKSLKHELGSIQRFSLVTFVFVVVCVLTFLSATQEIVGSSTNFSKKYFTNSTEFYLEKLDFMIYLQCPKQSFFSFFVMLCAHRFWVQSLNFRNWSAKLHRMGR